MVAREHLEVHSRGADVDLCKVAHIRTLTVI